MGHVRKRGERQYQARWFDDAGRERVKTFKLKGDADRHVKRMDAAVINGDYIDLSDPTTVTDAAWKWLKAHEGTPQQRHPEAQQLFDQATHRRYRARP
jgi:hypothetical protein